ncbi:hypothetical protein BG03_5743 (plasmid) [Bacillus cereus]|nr:hypothetical protein BG03_5743 [Bacillus cereus]
MVFEKYYALTPYNPIVINLFLDIKIKIKEISLNKIVSFYLIIKHELLETVKFNSNDKYNF